MATLAALPILNIKVVRIQRGYPPGHHTLRVLEVFQPLKRTMICSNEEPLSPQVMPEMLHESDHRIPLSVSHTVPLPTGTQRLAGLGYNFLLPVLNLT